MANTETQAAGAATAEAVEGGLLDQILTQSKIARSDSERSRAREARSRHIWIGLVMHWQMPLSLHGRHG